MPRPPPRPPPGPTAAWRCLPPGATVAVVAPAGPVAAERLAQVPALLQAQGWVARVAPGCHQQQGFLAGSDHRRLADLQAALDDPTVAAVWCLRGGHGSGRLLPALNLAGLAAAPKPLIGYSDITALHLLLDREGLPALHAPMPASDLLLPGRGADAMALFTLLREGLHAGHTWCHPPAPGPLHRGGVASGRLLGGNLSLLAASAGTPWQPDTRGRLLFIEEVGEAPYRVDRMLLQLQLAGMLAGVAGVLLGSFTEAEDCSAVLQDHLLALGVPLLAGWPAGHGTPNRPLPLGFMATLDADAGTLRFDQDVLRG